LKWRRKSVLITAGDKLMQALLNFWTEEEGQDLIEYTLLMAFLALSCVTLLGNGRSIVQAAKSHSSVPVVVVSGYVAEAFQAAEPLADLYLEKPVNPQELVTIVNELLKTSDKPATH
jgi:DNA-binding response OmpR family regulator